MKIVANTIQKKQNINYSLLNLRNIGSIQKIRHLITITAPECLQSICLPAGPLKRHFRRPRSFMPQAFPDWLMEPLQPPDRCAGAEQGIWREAQVDMEKIRSRQTTFPTDQVAPEPVAQDGHLVDLKRLERLRRLTRLMDNRWTIPGTRIPIGIDGIAGFVPVVGDTATALVSAYLLSECARFRLPLPLLTRMAANIGVDWLVGSIPVVGSVFDIAFKANRRNLNLLHQHLEERMLKAEQDRAKRKPAD